MINKLLSSTCDYIIVFDASAKAPVGMLYANNYQMGHFDECVSISVPKDGITGKYCLATVEFGPHKTIYSKFYEPPSKIHIKPNDYNSVWSILEVSAIPWSINKKCSSVSNECSVINYRLNSVNNSV